MSRMLVVLACLMLACGGRSAPPAQATTRPSAPSLLLPSESLGPPMMLEQRLTGQYGEGSSSLRCVLQLSQGVLTVIGLTPFGSRAFVLTQRGSDYQLEKMVDRPLPFDPRHVLVDIQRVLFRRALPYGQRPGDGIHERTEGEERIHEQWQDGILRERTFLDAGGTTLATVKFEGAAGPFVAQRVELRDSRHGYTLLIETVAQRVLPE